MLAAGWLPDGSTTPVQLGRISTLLAARGDPTAFQKGQAATGTGRLVIQVQTARRAGVTLGLPASRGGGSRAAGCWRSRADRTGAQHAADGRYVYLPAARVRGPAPSRSGWP